MHEDVIRQLPDSVANQIAAGEVIQRPASVIKELVENSIDAGARKIRVIIKDAGKTLIQVIDDGCGMSPTDARMAFERHATSKICCADDLFSLHTMGFRGEALPSIAAVSEVEMRTMRHDDTMGTCLVIKASKKVSQQPDVCTPGTNIMVKHLFYNFVARRRFLKRDSIELSHIMHEFERLALVNTQVDLSLIHNGGAVHTLPRGTLLQRVGQMFGRNVERQLVPVETVTTVAKISGYVGTPAAARVRNHLQYFFVNGRNMRHAYFRKAITDCYRELIANDAQPNFFINFEIDPSRIDVNVHPQKHEIKFEDENVIREVLVAAVKEALGKHNVGPAIDFDAVDMPDIPPMQQNTGAMFSEPVNDPLDPDYNPFETGASGSFNLTPPPLQQGLFDRNTAKSTCTSHYNPDFDIVAGQKAWQPSALTGYDSMMAQTALTIADEICTDSEGHERDLIQIQGRWIATPSKSGLMLIDQHRAHIRILYDRFFDKVNAGGMASQHLIFAEPLDLDAPARAVAQSAGQLLAEAGFALEDDGKTTTMTAAPADLRNADPGQTLLALINDLQECGDDPVEKRRHRVAMSLARSAAMPYNTKLSADEMQQIVDDLLKLPHAKYTPDGLATITILTEGQIAKLFN